MFPPHDSYDRETKDGQIGPFRSPRIMLFRNIKKGDRAEGPLSLHERGRGVPIPYFLICK